MYILEIKISWCDKTYFYSKKNLSGVCSLRLTEETSGAQTYNNYASAQRGAKGFLYDLKGSLWPSYRWPIRNPLEKAIIDSLKKSGKVSILINEGHIVSGKNVGRLQERFNI